MDRDAGSVYGVSEADTVSRSQALLLADKGKKGKGSSHQGGMLITERARRRKACSWERSGSLHPRASGTLQTPEPQGALQRGPFYLRATAWKRLESTTFGSFSRRRLKPALG